MLPTIRQLQAFIAVARHRNFSRAAAELHISQPALSQAIAQLESILTAPLFERTHRSIEMTDAARAFLVRAERITTTLDTAVREFQSAADPRQGKVVVSCMSLVATRLLPDVVKEFRQAFPGATVVVGDDYSPRILSAVKNGEADLGITALLDRPENLVAEALLEENFFFVCPLGHRLAGTQVEWKDLSPEEFVATTESSSMAETMLRAGIDRAFLDRSIYRVGRVTSVLEIVLQGGGVSVVPELALTGNSQRDRLYSCEMRNPQVRRTLSLIRAADIPLSATAAVFRELLLEHMRNRPPAGGVPASLARQPGDTTKTDVVAVTKTLSS